MLDFHRNYLYFIDTIEVTRPDLHKINIKKGLDKQVLFYISKIHNPIFFWHLIFEPKNRYNNFAILVLLLS